MRCRRSTCRAGTPLLAKRPRRSQGAHAPADGKKLRHGVVNDLLRGLDPVATKANLAAIIDRATSRQITVMLAGMQAPRNLGEDYAGEFNAIYTQLGARDGVIFYPFFLDGVALVPEFNQPDGMHPNRAGVDEIARRIRPTVEALLAAVPDD